MKHLINWWINIFHEACNRFVRSAKVNFISKVFCNCWPSRLFAVGRPLEAVLPYKSYLLCRDRVQEPIHYSGTLMSSASFNLDYACLANIPQDRRDCLKRVCWLMLQTQSKRACWLMLQTQSRICKRKWRFNLKQW